MGPIEIFILFWLIVLTYFTQIKRGGGIARLAKAPQLGEVRVKRPVVHLFSLHTKNIIENLPKTGTQTNGFQRRKYKYLPINSNPNKYLQPNLVSKYLHSLPIGKLFIIKYKISCSFIFFSRTTYTIILNQSAGTFLSLCLITLFCSILAFISSAVRAEVLSTVRAYKERIGSSCSEQWSFNQHF